MMDRTANDPLHGITLEVILNSLLTCYGWEGLAERVKIHCFSSNPSIKSSLKFLFVPFIFLDNGSLFLNIQSVETPVWLFIYALFFVGLYQIIRKRRELDYAVTIATLFALEFVAISALTEINVGTALRHRSLLLIPILVIWLSREKKPASL